MSSKITRFFSVICLAAIVLSLCLPFGVRAAGGIYVNDANGTLGSDITDSYAVGGGGTVAIVGDSYVLTDNGIVKLGDGGSVQPGVPSGAEDGTTIAVKTTTVRVGLSYGGDAKTSANLENKDGSGYKFGYFDANRVFVEVGSTTETKLTMVPDVNTAVTGGTIGAYHVRLGSYGSFADAKNAAAAYTGGFPAYYNGTYYAMAGNYSSSADAQAAATSLGGQSFTASNRAVAVTKTGTTQILFEFDYGTTAYLGALPVSTSGKAVTWYSGYAYYGGFEYYRYHSDKLTVINVVDIEDYVKGVIPYEMSNSWPMEALKAQAVCARTYFARNVNALPQYRIDVYNTAQSQVYRGTNLANATTNAAVDSTAGRYVTHNGAFCSTLYYSSNGGGSEDSENVFVTALPYLRGVLDPYEKDAASINSRNTWTQTVSKATISSKINAAGKAFGTLASFDVTYSKTGNAIAVTFTDTQGRTAVFEKGSCFDIFYYRIGLYSIHFTYEISGDNVVFNGGGWGHSVGMSQFGAYAMAKSHGFNYLQIIRYYYTGVNISKGV